MVKQVNNIVQAHYYIVELEVVVRQANHMVNQ